MKVKHNPNIKVEFEEVVETRVGTRHSMKLNYEGPLFIDLEDVDKGHIPSPVPIMLAELLCLKEELD